MRRRRSDTAGAEPFGSALAGEPLAPVVIAAAACVVLGAGLAVTADLTAATLDPAIKATAGIERLEADDPSPFPTPTRTRSTSPSPTPTVTATPEPTATAAPAPPPRAPRVDTEGVTRIRIDRIGVAADIIDLGLESDGSLEVPSVFAQTGWWTGGAVPGQVGPAVIVGHVSSRRGPAVFIDLDKLVAGDEVHVDFADGHTETFGVLWSARYRKAEFPTNLVYGATDAPTLRLVTCGGVVDPATNSFDSNDVVFLQHLRTTPSA